MRYRSNIRNTGITIYSFEFWVLSFAYPWRLQTFLPGTFSTRRQFCLKSLKTQDSKRKTQNYKLYSQALARKPTAVDDTQLPVIINNP